MKSFELMKHYRSIDLRRKLIAKKNYNLGLIVELEDLNIKNKEAKIQRLEKYKQEDLSLVNADANKINTNFERKVQIINNKSLAKTENNKVKAIKINKKVETIDRKIDNLTNLINKNEDYLISKNNEKLQELNKQILLDENLKDPKKAQKINYEINKLNAINILNENEEFQLTLTNLKMHFGGIKAVDDLSFYVKKGEIFGLIGPNGAGKTTVFNCITQFYKPTSGNINFKNKEGNIISLTNLNTHDIIKEGIARSFQNVELIWELTVLDNLMVSAHSLLITGFVDHMLHTRKMKKEEQILRTKGYKILQSLGIADYAFRSPYGLPYGVLKKIELARTLMTDPSMIILDEPAAGLNDAETKDLALVIKKINQDLGVTIFLVEHDMGLVMSICDTICAISFGKMLAIGTPKEIQTNPEVRKAYLGDDSDE